MKNFKRKRPIISPIKVAIAALYAAIATAVTYFLTGSGNEWVIICSGLFIVLVIADIFVIIPSGYRYLYSDSYIKLLYLSIVYRKINYSNYDSIFISNASYNNGYGFGVYGNIPMQYKSKEKKTTVYPFITLHKPDYPVYKPEAGMSSRDLLLIDNQATFCLGICWFDSLSELLDYTTIPVYILEDVYLRFREEFDSILVQRKNDINRFYVVSDHGIEYKNYLDNN